MNYLGWSIHAKRRPHLPSRFLSPRKENIAHICWGPSLSWTVCLGGGFMNAQGINSGPGVSCGRRLYIYTRLRTWLRRKLSGKEARGGCHSGLWALARQPMKNFQETMGKGAFYKWGQKSCKVQIATLVVDINCLHFHALTRKPGDFQVTGTPPLIFTRKVRYYSSFTVRKL